MWCFISLQIHHWRRYANLPLLSIKYMTNCFHKCSSKILFHMFLMHLFLFHDNPCGISKLNWKCFILQTWISEHVTENFSANTKFIIITRLNGFMEIHAEIPRYTKPFHGETRAWTRSYFLFWTQRSTVQFLTSFNWKEHFILLIFLQIEQFLRKKLSRGLVYFIHDLNTPRKEY
jgi:hypothetical protein